MKKTFMAFILAVSLSGFCGSAQPLRQKEKRDLLCGTTALVGKKLEIGKEERELINGAMKLLAKDLFPEKRTFWQKLLDLFSIKRS